MRSNFCQQTEALFGRLRPGTLGAWLLLILCAPSGHASSPDFAPRVTELDTTLVRVGQGTARYAGFIAVYDAALYTQAEVDPGNILQSAVAKRLEIVYRVSLKAGDMIKAAERTLSRQHSQEALARWRAGNR